MYTQTGIAAAATLAWMPTRSARAPAVQREREREREKRRETETERDRDRERERERERRGITANIFKSVAAELSPDFTHPQSSSKAEHALLYYGPVGPLASSALH